VTQAGGERGCGRCWRGGGRWASGEGILVLGLGRGGGGRVGVEAREGAEWWEGSVAGRRAGVEGGEEMGVSGEKGTADGDVRDRRGGLTGLRLGGVSMARGRDEDGLGRPRGGEGERGPVPWQIIKEI